MRRPLGMLFAFVLGLSALAIFGGREPESAPKPIAAQSQATLIDINRASAMELLALKGIGKTRTEAIIKGRPYTRKDELVQKKIIPASVYDEIKDQIIARQR